MKSTFWQGFWRLADPKISLASFASMFLGVCAAAADGSLHLGWLVFTIIGIFAIEVAKNASGDIFDFDSGDDKAVREEDRSPFSGGKRVLLDNLLTRRQTVGIAFAGYLVGCLTGLAILIWREPSVFWIGVAGVTLAFFYHAPPIKLSYRGLGEIAVAICYGPLIATGTYLVQRGAVSIEVIATSLLLGLLIGLFLLINEFPDFHADLSANKRTLVVMWGRRRASRIYLGLLALTFALAVALPLFQVPFTVWLGLIAVIPAYPAAKRLIQYPETTSNIIPAQAATLFAFLLFALGSGIGFLLS
jgi:1,4-dihydroxy-2-naphthoate octaprenyltransferase